MINNKTKLFVSLSKFPGNTGAKLHNHGFALFGLNCIYVPLKCDSEKSLKSILFNENFKGISISMPFKSKVIKFLDKLDNAALKTKSVNTILKREKSFYGYNTDFYAIKKKIKNNLSKIHSSTIIGNGSTGKTAFEALKELKINEIFLVARNPKKYKTWKLNKSSKIINWKKRNQIKSNLLINCTPIGMHKLNKLPINIISNNQFDIIIDLPINNDSKLSKLSKKFKIKYISGEEISLIQGIEQFRLYNKKKLNFHYMKKKLNYKF